MRKILLTFTGSLLALLFFGLNPVVAQAPTSESITLFKSTINQESNTDINIIEEIHYFFPGYKHGIIREIPVNYKVRGGMRRPTTLKLNELYYYRKDQPERKYDLYERSMSSGHIVLKIGDPERTVTGEYVYVIDYTLKNAVNYFDDHDELFLNITGNGWSVPILSANSEITIPGELVESLCYTGVVGSTEEACVVEQQEDGSINVVVNRPLLGYEGYTVALKMPKGSLDDTTNRQRVAFLLSNLGLLLPIPVFIFLLKLVKSKGKNKKITIFPHYEPEKGMYPLLSGYIYKKKLDTKHITAQIIQNAIDGYLVIKQEGNRKYILEKKKEYEGGTTSSVEILHTGLFEKSDSVDTKKIPTNFYLTVRKIFNKLDADVYENDIFSKDRRKIRKTMSIVGFVSLFITPFFSSGLAMFALASWGVGIAASAVLLIVMAYLIDIRSEEGNRLYYELEGLKMYINTAEKHRIEFHNDPEKFKGVFEALLPYAIIFGLEKKWAGEFKDIYKEPPSWYQGDTSTFNSYILANSISNLSRNVHSKSTPPGSSGGFSSSHGASGGSGFSGGSSGGGFGGGGGSSW